LSGIDAVDSWDGFLLSTLTPAKAQPAIADPIRSMGGQRAKCHPVFV